MLGHTTVKVTERYAHLAGTVLETAARETALSALALPAGFSGSAENPGSHLRDLNSRPTVYEPQGESSDIAPVGLASVRERAVEALELAEAGDVRAWTAMVRALGELLEATAGETPLRRVG